MPPVRFTSREVNIPVAGTFVVNTAKLKGAQYLIGPPLVKRQIILPIVTPELSPSKPAVQHLVYVRVFVFLNSFLSLCKPDSDAGYLYFTGFYLL